MTISIPDKSAETVIYAYLQQVFTTFRGSLILINDNGKEVMSNLFQKIREELGNTNFHP